MVQGADDVGTQPAAADHAVRLQALRKTRGGFVVAPVKYTEDINRDIFLTWQLFNSKLIDNNKFSIYLQDSPPGRGQAFVDIEKRYKKFILRRNF